MQTKPQSQENFCDLDREAIAMLADAQRRLLMRRECNHLPRDPRSLQNLKRLEMAEARLNPGSSQAVSQAVSQVVSRAATGQQGWSVTA